MLPVGLIGRRMMGSSRARQMGALREIRVAAACDVDEAREQELREPPTQRSRRT